MGVTLRRAHELASVRHGMFFVYWFWYKQGEWDPAFRLFSCLFLWDGIYSFGKFGFLFRLLLFFGCMVLFGYRLFGTR